MKLAVVFLLGLIVGGAIVGREIGWRTKQSYEAGKLAGYGDGWAASLRQQIRSWREHYDRAALKEAQHDD